MVDIVKLTSSALKDVGDAVNSALKKSTTFSSFLESSVYNGARKAIIESKSVENYFHRIFPDMSGIMDKLNDIIEFLNDFSYSEILKDFLEIIKDIDLETIKNARKFFDFKDPIKLDDIIETMDDEFDLFNGEIKEYQPVDKNWYPDIDYSPRVYNGKTLNYYDFVKIRKNLAYFTEKKGFPMAFAKDLNFTMFIGIRIPTGFTVHKLETIKLWKKEKSARWRKVMIYYRGAEFTQFAISLASQFPYISSSMFYLLQEFALRTLREFPIYENLAYTSSLNDGLIIANWDKIKKEFEREYD